MTKEQMFDLVRLLSALESWSFSTKNPLPDYLFENLDGFIDLMRKELVK